MATVSSRTVAINAAFLQEIKLDNTALRGLLESIRRLVGQSWSKQAQATRFTLLLGELRDQLAMHFALEEAFGYFEDAVSQAPQLCERAQVLRGQHPELFTELCTLVEEAEESAVSNLSLERWSHRLIVAFRRFDRRLREHELGENELIFAAFDDDIGVGD
jgi:hypothetical protein